MAFKKEKLESRIRRSLSELMIKEVKDPRIGFVSITRVDVNKDYSIATVGISVLGNPREIRKSLEGLRSSSGYLQHRLNKSMEMRHTPRIVFELDSSVMDAVNMVGLIDTLDTGSDPEEDSDGDETGTDSSDSGDSGDSGGGGGDGD